ncbi:PAS domain-containing protein [Actinoplanes aureus]|uniref:PAS domain-containing protein n=1 Tax=Actinoplanes aureus TaxID=2792083 RepID=UPI002815B893|nr:PAS domain-containing protein [Actinoplanes aureus]
MTAGENDLARGTRTETPALDRLTRAAARVLRAPMAGVFLPGDPRRPARHPASRYVHAENAPLIVTDARADHRVSTASGEGQHVVAYAGHPLRGADGAAVGTFFVTDIVPRRWTDEDLANLADLAAAAEALVASDSGSDAFEREQERAFLQALLNSLDTGVAACGSDGRLAQFNPAMREIHGLGLRTVGAEAWATTYHLYRADGRTRMSPDEVPLARAYAGESVQHEEMVIRTPERAPRRFLANARPIDTPDGRRLGAVVAMHEVTEAHRAEMLRRCRARRRPGTLRSDLGPGGGRGGGHRGRHRVGLGARRVLGGRRGTRGDRTGRRLVAGGGRPRSGELPPR